MTEQPEYKGLAWILQQSWLEESQGPVTWAPEELKWMQTEIIICIMVSVSIFLAMIGCGCLRIPYHTRNGLRHLAHALRVWKSKLPPAEQWGLWTCLTSTVSGFVHCCLCCLYKKDNVRLRSKPHKRAEDMFEMDFTNYGQMYGEARGTDTMRRVPDPSLPPVCERDEEGFYGVRLTPPRETNADQGTINRGSQTRSSDRRQRIPYHGPLPESHRGSTMNVRAEVHRPTYPAPAPPPIPAPRSAPAPWESQSRDEENRQGYYSPSTSATLPRQNK